MCPIVRFRESPGNSILCLSRVFPRPNVSFCETAQALEAFAGESGLLPEQIWDTADIPERGLFLGQPAGSAMPLAWAHAEYIKLVRSLALGRSIDRPEAAWRRYEGIRPAAHRATWRFTAPRPTMVAGRTLRFELLAPCRVHCSLDGWQTTAKPRSQP